MTDDDPPRPFEPGAVTILVPAKDEDEAIGTTLRTLPLGTLRAMGFDPNVVVLDGQSTDRTAAIARDLGATVLEDEGRGKGRAFRRALPRVQADYVVMLDGDGTYAADAVPRAIHLLARDEADVVMGRRRPRPGAMKASHRVGNRLLSLEASLLYLTRCPDLCTGFWAFTGPALGSLAITADGFELEADLFAAAAQQDLRIATVELDYLERQGEPKLSFHRDGLRIAWWLLRSRFVSDTDGSLEPVGGPSAAPVSEGGSL